MVVVLVVGEIVGLCIEGVVALFPLQFEVKIPEGAESLIRSSLGIVKPTVTILQREVPLSGEVADDAVMERSDKLVAEEGHTGSIVGILFRVGAVFVVVAVTEGEPLGDSIVAPETGEVEAEEGFRANVVDVAVGGSVEVCTIVFYPVNHIGAVTVETLGLSMEELPRVAGSEVPVGALFWLQKGVALKPWPIVVNVCISGCS